MNATIANMVLVVCTSRIVPGMEAGNIESGDTVSSHRSASMSSVPYIMNAAPVQVPTCISNDNLLTSTVRSTLRSVNKSLAGNSKESHPVIV